ncbi:DUF2752 domain-containing protein [Kitasatospora phosalacinea]|uniref:DUF2752 domain-containing protein n=1 Tax=Kitasatospora phosalacinea TaxID=2065 RepID=UPI00255785E6|nr:DUF2752 domain-containing protein [Kitasatospora phosalacinea]
MNAPAAPDPAASGPSAAPGGPVVRRLVRPLAALTAVALPTAFVGLVDPNAPGHYPTCPFLQLTGWWCPGCGGLRCVHALTRGDVLTAAHDNLLVVVLALGLAVLWSGWLVRSVRGAGGRPGWWPRMSRRRAWALALVLLVFTALRNLPVGAGLAPPGV